MANNISPGVYTREIDLTTVNTQVGLTSLGLVGETLKGPAFEPIFITNSNEFRTRFGGQSTAKFGDGTPKYELPYIANEYLKQSNQLYVSRVLGLSGYDAGKAWALRVAAPNSSDPVDDETIAIIRPRASYTGDTLNFKAKSIVIDLDVSASTFEPLSTFRIIASSNASIPAKTDTGSPLVTVTDILNAYNLNSTDGAVYEVSFNETSDNFIKNVIGDANNDKGTMIYAEEVNTALLKSYVDSDVITGIRVELVELPVENSNYKSPFKAPETPWVVSQILGSKIERMFKFVSISDGNSANQEIKISIQNINFDSKEFDIVIRDFNDTDAKPVVLESFPRCTMVPNTINYAGMKIGTEDGEYPLKSKYVYLIMAEKHSTNLVPAGFEGYIMRNYGSDAKAPSMLYNTVITNAMRVSRVYLGISDIVGIDRDRFNYFGEPSSLCVKSLGFHMDADASNMGDFKTTTLSFKSTDDFTGTPWEKPRDRKFTLAPAGGFDGWDIHRTNRTNRDTDAMPVGTAQNSDYHAFLNGILTFENPEDLFVNIFGTPGIDYDQNLDLVQRAIEMVEEQRKDCIYITTTPLISKNGNTVDDVAAIMRDSPLDSTYTATYAPWVQYFDTENNGYIFLPPTLEVARDMAYTDRVRAPWFAPAGFDRGTISSKRTSVKLNNDTGDTLISNRINPIRSFGTDGLKIMGQRTLQIEDTALSRINVRRLMLQLSKMISNVAIRLVFEQDDEELQDQFKTLINPILTSIKQQRGVYEFKITCDSSNNTPDSIDRLELNAVIQIKPTRSAEYINIDYVLTPTGASFTL